MGIPTLTATANGLKDIDMNWILIAALRAVTASPETYNAWRALTDKEIRQEYEWEYPKVEPVFGDIFPTADDFVTAAKQGKIVTLTKSRDRQIAYRSHSDDLAELKEMVESYRFPRDVDRIVEGYENNAAIPYPIVLDKNGSWRIMSGNTRLDTAFILGVTPKILVVEVPDGD